MRETRSRNASTGNLRPLVASSYAAARSGQSAIGSDGAGRDELAVVVRGEHDHRVRAARVVAARGPRADHAARRRLVALAFAVEDEEADGGLVGRLERGSERATREIERAAEPAIESRELVSTGVETDEITRRGELSEAADLRRMRQWPSFVARTSPARPTNTRAPFFYKGAHGGGV